MVSSREFSYKPKSESKHYADLQICHFLTEIERKPMEGQDLIYHYTNADGMLGIIRNRKLWATDFSFMNDPGEVRYVSQELHGRLSSLHNDPSHEISKFLEFLSNEYPDTKTALEHREDRAFITSFSDRDTHLTLWRLYAGKNGFSLGFDQDELLAWVDPPFDDIDDDDVREGRGTNYGHGAAYYTVGYGDGAREEILNELLELLCRSDFTFENNIDEINLLLDKFVSVKHDAYSDERETRLVLRNGSCHTDSKVRVSASMGIVPFVELAFPSEALKKIRSPQDKNSNDQRTVSMLHLTMEERSAGPMSA